MEQQQMTALTAKDFFSKDSVKKKFQELMGKNASQFITSVLQIVASNELLSKADPQSIYQSAAVAATLQLPLNNALGMAYIIPFNQKKKDGTYKVIAQFQIGYKGFIQLALRSGQFRNISATPIYEGQIISENPLTGYEFDFKVKPSGAAIGYASYFKLVNGFEKTVYMSLEEVKAHGARFSQTFKKGYGLWKDDFESMAIKTVLKLALAKYAPLSIDMQQAVQFDQGLIKDADNNDVEYPDNETVDIDAELVSEQKENDRITAFIKNAKSKKELTEAEAADLTIEQRILFDERFNTLPNE